MKNLIQRLPLVALIVGTITFVGNAKGEADQAYSNNQFVDVQWLYTPPATDDDPTNEDYYTYHPSNDLESECTGSEDVCGVSAPSQDPANPSNSKPDLSDIESDLEQDNPNSKIHRGEFSR